MATANIYRTTFSIVRGKTPPFAGASHFYRREVRTVLCAAQSDQGLQAVLVADIPLAGGESIEILASQQVVSGTDGGSVLT